MKKEFKLELFNGHPLITDEGNVILIDTGNPTTLHTSGTLSFMGEEHACSTNLMGIDVSRISEMIRTEISTLMGTDIISQYLVLFDYRNNSITFSKEETDLPGSQEARLSSFMKVPLLNLQIEENELSFMLDSGAKLSYLDPEHTRDHPITGEEEDFFPAIGRFKTECFEIPVKLGDETFTGRFGHLPSLLQQSLGLSGAAGIIGYDLFSSFRILLDLGKGIMKYTR